VVPDVAPPRPLAGCLQALGAPGADELRLCVWEGGAAPLDRALDDAGRVAGVRVLVGPEGGLAPAEVDLARAHGFVVASLGPRILRTETAGPAIVAVLQYRFGDLAQASGLQ
jgi:16S rRNA (uracil1498-N3)-methyltransferase